MGLREESLIAGIEAKRKREPRSEWKRRMGNFETETPPWRKNSRRENQREMRRDVET